MISGALYQRETIEFDFLLCIKEAFFARPKSATLMLSKVKVSNRLGLTVLIKKDVVWLDVSVED